MGKVKMRVNKALAQKVGLNKYLPVSHYSSHATASSDRNLLVRTRRSLKSKDVKVCYEGKIHGKTPIYSVLARTKRQMLMARRVLRKRRKR